MIRTRASAAALAFATAFVWVGMALGILAMPVASADTLPNGLTVNCTKDSDIHSTCIVGGCPRVNGDYVVDALHVMYDGGGQSEYDFKCINGQTYRVGSIGDTPNVNFGVQACRKKDFEGDWCTPYAHYSFTPPAPAAPAPAPDVQCPAGSVAPTVPAGQQCTAVPKPDVVCPPGSPTPTVPAGQQCGAVPAAPTDAVSISVAGAGFGKIDVTLTNSSAISGSCDYVAKPTSNPLGVLPTVSKTVDIGANATAVIPGQTAPPGGIHYNLSVKCTGKYVDGTTVQFGQTSKTI